jgi:hypothetical protein
VLSYNRILNRKGFKKIFLENENLLDNELTDLQQTNYDALKSCVFDLKNE